MQEVKQRVANIIRFLSMIAAIGSLLFMYAYSTDQHAINHQQTSLFYGISKTTLFYAGLVVFLIFNTSINWGIGAYRSAEGSGQQLHFLSDETRKNKVLFWLTLLMAAINIMIASLALFAAVIMIDGPSHARSYAYMPIVGLLFLLVVLAALIASVVRK
jgi:TRAP-type C4-dicarboxylate transport system permease small subunit